MGKHHVSSCLIVAVVMIISQASADDNHHPPQDQAIHKQFYSTWMMPDNRSMSCCGGEDCAPAESYLLDGHWMARKVGETGNFTPVPDKKVEKERDNPDGRSHLCSSTAAFPRGSATVYCFIAGTGS